MRIWAEDVNYIFMKKDIHPTNYRPVVFKDVSNGEMFLISSTIETEETIKYEGKEYPMYEVEISSTSHPFYTGDQRIMDTAGRAERFRQRAAKAQPRKAKKVAKAEEAPKEETVEAPAEA